MTGRTLLAAPLGVVAGLCAGPRVAAAAPDPAPAEVAQAIGERRSRVAEFQLVKEAAEELGVRVWLFGGTAAGYAHYVRWDLAREGGDPRYRESFFDYDFTNIYRSTQDADLVVDGTPEQAQQLEGLIRQKMSFLQGSKEHWEVRLLRHPRTVGGQVKLPLLANPDFLDQNTDSNSTGMIELTEPPPDESVVRDLRDWESSTPFFLQDVTHGRLHYYQSPTHQQTSRYLSGDNPPLFSVIRYLVKAFQYGLQVEGDDLARVRAIIEAFDPKKDYAALSPWAKGWLERYGPNLIRHSVNVEQSWVTLERLGLRQKLSSLSDPARSGSLGWWLSREPLRTRTVGEGGGRTAAELGIEVVAHETSDFLAYESITRDTTLRPNVLISRPGHAGELAASGPGFYTRLGRTGARGTGLTIRFRVDPQAREGSDFSLHGDYVLFSNRAALQVIPESLQASWPDYFQMLEEGVIDPSDRGAWMKLKRRLSLQPPSPEEETRMVGMVGEAIGKLRRTGEPKPIIQEWFALPVSQRHPELIERLKEAVSQEIERLEGKRRDRPPSFRQRDWGSTTLLEWLALPVPLDQKVIPGSLTAPLLRVLETLRNGPTGPGEPQAGNEPPALAPGDWELLKALLRSEIDRAAGEDRRSPFLRRWFDLPLARSHPEIGEALAAAAMARIDQDVGRPLYEYRLSGFLFDWLSSASAPDHPQVVERLVRPRVRNYPVAMSLFPVLALPHWKDRNPQLRDLFVRLAPLNAIVPLLERAEWADHPELVLGLIARLQSQYLWTPETLKIGGMLGLPHWRGHPLLRELSGGQPPTIVRLWPHRLQEDRAGRVVRGLDALSGSPPSGECR